MFIEGLKLIGDVDVVLTDASGKVKDSREIRNLIVDTGLNYICERMKEAVETAMTHMGVGSGTTAAAAGDLDLETQIGARKALTDTVVSTNTVTYTCTFAAGEGTGAITEAGIMNASTSGTLLARTVFAVVNKGADDTMAITWTITLTAS